MLRAWTGAYSKLGAARRTTSILLRLKHETLPPEHPTQTSPPQVERRPRGCPDGHRAGVAPRQRHLLIVADLRGGPRLLDLTLRHHRGEAREATTLGLLDALVVLAILTARLRDGPLLVLVEQ